jgi:agmatinase
MSLQDPDGPARPEDGLFGAEVSEADARVVVLPVPYEATTSYGAGTAEGPEAIRRASGQLDLYDRQTGRPYRAGIAYRPAPGWIRSASSAMRVQVERATDPTTDAEEVARATALVNDAGLRVRDATEADVDELLEAGKLVAIVGGDHSVPLGSIRAHAKRHPGLGILHVDAHADLRVAYEGFVFSHASIMERVLAEAPGVERIVQVGLRDVSESEVQTIEGSGGRVMAYFDDEIARARLGGRLLDLFAEAVGQLPEAVYLSFDIDGLDPSLCPNTGTPVPGGLGFTELALLLEALVSSGRRVLGLDLCEVAPSPMGHEWDANVGARVLYKMIGFALRSRGEIY